MASPRIAAENVIREFLGRIKKDPASPLDAPLYADGVGLDSLETAELSALLEDEFGSDPFSSADELPQTLAEVLDHYGAAVEAEAV
ncbi:phosphopantetheine-binding protein [Nocardioides albidus]|uniref:phosphopantetheine-binding protein n=1 Tax=Nocardioides albidus TaxID=1517589 RepID=UPI00130510BC|nr:phosphopantetheine-binding protein [Nocardioides albidus]